MNERLKELARESGLLIYNPNGVPTKLEKFAELIIKECAKIGDSGDPMQDGGIARMIKQHFGIES
jgi:hypothetical protein